MLGEAVETKLLPEGIGGGGVGAQRNIRPSVSFSMSQKIRNVLQLINQSIRAHGKY